LWKIAAAPRAKLLFWWRRSNKPLELRAEKEIVGSEKHVRAYTKD